MFDCLTPESETFIQCNLCSNSYGLRNAYAVRWYFGHLVYLKTQPVHGKNRIITTYNMGMFN